MSAVTILSLCLTIYLVQGLNYRAREFVIPVPPTDKGAALLIFTAFCVGEGTTYIVYAGHTIKGFLPADYPKLVRRISYSNKSEVSELPPVRLLFSRQVALLVTLMEDKGPYWTTTRYTFLGPEIATSKYQLCYLEVSETARAYMLAHRSDSFLTVIIKPGSKGVTTATIVVNNETRSGGGETVSVDLSPNHYSSATASWMKGMICGSTIEGSKVFVLYTDQNLSGDKKSKEGTRIIQQELPEQLRYGRLFVFVIQDGLEQAVLMLICPSKLPIQIVFGSLKHSFECSPPATIKRIRVDAIKKARQKAYLISLFVEDQEEQNKIAASLLLNSRAQNVNTLAHGVPLNTWSNRYAWMRPSHAHTKKNTMLNAANVYILNSRPKTNNFYFNGRSIKFDTEDETKVNDTSIGFIVYSVENVYFVIASESQILVYVTMYHKDSETLIAAEYAIPVDDEQKLNCSKFCPTANCVFDYTVNGSRCSLCKAGYYTLDCTVCEQGTYGKDCARNCLDFCSEPFCEPNSGKCIGRQIPWHEKIGHIRIAVALVVPLLVLPACCVYFIYRYYTRPSMLRAKMQAAMMQFLEDDPYWQYAEEYGVEYYYEEMESSGADVHGQVYSENSYEVDYSEEISHCVDGVVPEDWGYQDDVGQAEVGQEPQHHKKASIRRKESTGYPNDQTNSNIGRQPKRYQKSDSSSSDDQYDQYYSTTGYNQNELQNTVSKSYLINLFGEQTKYQNAVISSDPKNNVDDAFYKNKSRKNELRQCTSSSERIMLKSHNRKHLHAFHREDPRSAKILRKRQLITMSKNANATEFSTETPSEKLNTGDIYLETFSEYGHHERNFENNRQSFYNPYGVESTNAMTRKEVNGHGIYRSCGDTREVPHEYRIRSLIVQTESFNSRQRCNSGTKEEIHAERKNRSAGVMGEMNNECKIRSAEVGGEMHDERKIREAVARREMHNERKISCTGARGERHNECKIREAIARGEMHDERKIRSAVTRGEMYDRRNVRNSGAKGEMYQERKMREAVARGEMHDERKIKNTGAKGEFFDEHNSKRSLVKSKGKQRRSKFQRSSRDHRKFSEETQNRNAGARRDVFCESQRGRLENDMSAFEPQALMVGPEVDSDEEVRRDIEGGFSLAHKMRKMKEEGQTADLYGPIHAYKETSV